MTWKIISVAGILFILMSLLNFESYMDEKKKAGERVSPFKKGLVLIFWFVWY